MGLTYLYQDFETRSEVDLQEVGLDNYSRHPSTEPLMLSYGFNENPVDLWQPHLKSSPPPEVVEALKDPHVIKVAWNAEFERTIWDRQLGIQVPTVQWVDPMIWSRHLSMPGALDTVGPLVGVPADMQKMDEGERLINLFCLPEVPSTIQTLFNVSPIFFRDWETDPEDWAKFCLYCKNDTIAEREILHRIRKFPLPDIEQRGWILDQKINATGMPVNLDFVRGALDVAKREVLALNATLKEITGLDNPNSRKPLLRWLQREGYRFNSIGKEEVNRSLSEFYVGDLSPLAQKVLKLRLQASKTSYRKYEAILMNVGPDGRLRYQFSFLGAARAGRWTGHDVQLQNLPRPNKEVDKMLALAIDLLQKADERELIKNFKTPIMEIVASCIRSSFQAPKGFKFTVCDLNAIENRVLGWVARCKSILDVFAAGKCPYLSFAALLFGVPYEDLITIDEHGIHKAKDAEASIMRQQAKPAVLGAGYRLGGGDEIQNKFGDTIKTGLWGYADGMGIKMPREDAHRAVKIFRDSYPEVVQLWYDLEEASFNAVRNPGNVYKVGPVEFQCFGAKVLRILLPSGRGLHYIRPMIEMLPFGTDPRTGEPRLKKTLTYAGIDQETRQWTRVTTHGGKLTENIVQAISRDILLHAMFLADAQGFEICGHVHDEIISLRPDLPEHKGKDLIRLRECMIARPPWASDLPLNAEGYEGYFYKKG